MSDVRLITLTTLAMLAFAGNSLLCRLALKETEIDASSFTAIRLISGALILWLIMVLRHNKAEGQGSWWSALSLFLYAAGFSFAYISLAAGTGALLLFGAVQVSMISVGLWRGERLVVTQWFGFMLAFGGLLGLLLPGLSAPPIVGASLMLMAGVAWGVYSLRGKGAGDPVGVTAGNFIRTVPMALVLVLVMYGQITADWSGTAYAIASGVLASGIGYVIWYAALPSLQATTAASVQLTVPVIAALGGVVLLSEPISWRLVLAAVAILGGVAMVIRGR